MSVPSEATGLTGTTTGFRRFVPTRDQLVDGTALVLLAVAALAGLGTTYTGVGFLVVGVVGLLLGLAVAFVAERMRWPLVATVMVTLVLFFVLGGPLCLRSNGAGALLPGPTTVGGLADQALFGWKDLLTTLPPVDGDGPALVLPWLLGLATGALGGVLAFRLRTSPTPVLAPVLLLVAVILLGVRYPSSLLVQGVVFAALALGWMALRGRRTTEQTLGTHGGGWRKLALGVALVAVASALALPTARFAFGADDPDDSERVVLRNYVETPFDIGQYPSPLASFRRYVKDARAPRGTNVFDTAMFQVDGVPAGTRLRIATLDHYDGRVWGASNQALDGDRDDLFQRVSSTIDNPVPGPTVAATVRVEKGYAGVWLPTVGALQGVTFDTDTDTGRQADSFRYNLATSTGIVPAGVNPGDRYSFSAVLDDETLTPNTPLAQEVGSGFEAAAFLETQATEWSAGATDPTGRLLAIAEHLKREGRYSDGVVPAEQIYHPGHGVHRLLDEFVNYPIMAGNDEQYAAVMALLANRIGIPARVVVGAVLPDGGAVHGRDVSAWVEVLGADGRWRTLPTDDFMDYDKPAELPPQQKQQMSGVDIPPPAAVAPPSTVGEQTDAELNSRKGDRDPDDGGWPRWVEILVWYVALPLLAVALLVGAVVGLKAWRRRRRRVAERASTRVLGAWRELLDHARDLGTKVPHGGAWTRREQSAHLAVPSARPLAERADALVFGPDHPELGEAEAYWAAVDAERRAMTGAASRKRRLLALVSVTTFLPGGRQAGAGIRTRRRPGQAD